MTTPFPSRRRRGSAAPAVTLCVAATALGPVRADAQTVPAQYVHGLDTARLVVHLDTIGVTTPWDPTGGFAPPPVEELQALGFALEDTLNGVFIFSRSTAAASRSQIFAEAQSLVEDRPGSLANAGPLVRYVASGQPFVFTNDFAVRFRPVASQVQIDSLMNEWGVAELRPSPFDPSTRLLRLTENRPEDVVDVLLAFERSPLTEWALPNRLGGNTSNEVIPEDERFADQWHLKNGDGSVGDINATHAWEHSMGSSDVVIGIVELGGFDLSHPDLEEQLWVNEDEVPGNGIDDDGNGLTDDVSGWAFVECWDVNLACGQADVAVGDLDHGTAVAGLAVGETDGVEGIVGVCPGCRLMPLVAGLAKDDWGTALAIEYAWQEGASVVNLSWSGGRPHMAEEAIKNATSLGRGGLGVPIAKSVMAIVDDFCQGPDGWNMLASIEEVTSVSSSDDEDMRVPVKTGYGDCLDLLAPGGHGGNPLGLTTSDAIGTAGYNPPDPGPTECMSRPEASHLDYTNCFGGTSAATPIVAGVMGLMLSVAPDLTRGEVHDVLIRTAEKIDCDAASYTPACPPSPDKPAPYAHSVTHGHGRVDALAAVEAAMSNAACAACEGLELGTRIGWVQEEEEAFSGIPGGGPSGLPVIHVSKVFDFTSVTWMAEAQFGVSDHSTGDPATEERKAAVAVQLAWLTAMCPSSVYVGVNFAVRNEEIGGTASTDSAFGLALGYRWTPLSQLALRLETVYRRWNESNTDEVGLAAGFGVLLN